jgi:nucleosome binding factor SPN SPT16 subunit
VSIDFVHRPRYWLTEPSYSSVDIATSEGPVNLSWPAIMKTIQDDTQEFYKMGGWDFLGGGGSDDEDSESSAESEFEASDVADDASEDSDEDSDGKFRTEGLVSGSQR